MVTKGEGAAVAAIATVLTVGTVGLVWAERRKGGGGGELAAIDYTPSNSRAGIADPLPVFCKAKDEAGAGVADVPMYVFVQGATALIPVGATGPDGTLVFDLIFQVTGKYETYVANSQIIGEGIRSASAEITVTEGPGPSLRPEITSPEEDATVNPAGFIVTGTAPPGMAAIHVRVKQPAPSNIAEDYVLAESSDGNLHWAVNLSVVDLTCNRLLVQGTPADGGEKIFSAGRLIKYSAAPGITQYYMDVVTPGDEVNINDTTATMYGMLAGPASQLIGKVVNTMKVALKKAAAAAGPATFEIVDVLGGTKYTFGTMEAATVPIAGTDVKMINKVVAPYTIVAGDRIVVRYSGPDGLRMGLSLADAFDGANTQRTRYGPSLPADPTFQWRESAVQDPCISVGFTL